MNCCATHFKGALRLGCFVTTLFVLLASPRFASAYNLIHGFAGAPSDGSTPFHGTVATDGATLYGLTENGGSTNAGVLFKVGISGSGYQVMHSFAGTTFLEEILNEHGDLNDGANPQGAPLLLNSTLYGLTSAGGSNGFGALFSISAGGGSVQVLHHFGGFNPTDGTEPLGGLVTDGATLYGMTSSGGSGDEGILFSISTNGTNYQIMHNFTVVGNDGVDPQGSLLLSGGVLYGMTLEGGSNSQGTIFKINASGTGYQIIHHFGDFVNDGGSPYGSLIISNSTLYGMTSNGGSNNVGCVFSVQTDGSNFQLLHSFGTGELWQPKGDLTLSNSTLYGMARNGGTNGIGLGGVFQLSTTGSGYQFVHVFGFGVAINTTDGSTPEGSLLLSGSQLYGMTTAGGSLHDGGALFSLAPGNGGGGGGGGGGSPEGGLRVNILPATAVKAGAEWQVNGGTLMKSGALFTTLTGGPSVLSFTKVTGFTAPLPQILDITLGTTNTINADYIALDLTAPTLQITSPTAKLVATTNNITATGTASDNVAVASVKYQLNGGPWTLASTSNNWANWSATNLTLTPGVNTFKAFALDTSTNASATNTVSFTYIVSVGLVVNTNGQGTIKPNLNNTVQQIGKVLSMTAKASKGSAFVNWTGSIITNSTKLTFVMASNLNFTANFKDIARPVNVILSPTKNQIVTNGAPVATGRAMDNVGVTAVSFQVNVGAWIPAVILDGNNWTTPSLSTTLISGPNSISAFAQDAAGNASLTNTVLFTYRIEPVADWAPDSLNGLVVAVTPGNGPSESVGFDNVVFAQTGATNDPDASDFGAGGYAYVKTDTNRAQLSFSFTNAPSSSNNFGPITLVFTNHYEGYFTNDDGDTGGINAIIATNFVPATVAGKTITAISSNNGKPTSIKLSTTTFVKTPANNSNTGTSIGNYAFQRYSPVCGIFDFAFTDPADAGSAAFVQATFTSAAGGTYFVTVFNNLGVLVDTDQGTFTLK